MPTDRESLAVLRDRVYGPGATDDDRRRYAERLAGSAPDEGEEDREDREAPADETEPPARRPARRLAVVVAAALAAAALIATAVVLMRPSAAVHGPPPAELPVSADDRATMVNALTIGTDAGIAAYLVTNRAASTILNAASAYTVEQHGVGPKDLDVLTLPRTDHGLLVDGRTGETLVADSGRVTVLLVVTRSADVGWRAEQGSRVVAERGGFQSPGELTTATVDYAAGHRPNRLRVDVPPGTAWGVAVVYTS